MTTHTIYTDANEYIESFFQKMGCLLYGVVIPMFFLPALIHSYYAYYVQDAGEEAFVLSLPITLPFNQKTPFGFLIAFTYDLIQYNINNTVHFVDCFVFFGLCMLLKALADDFKHSLEMFDKDIGDSMKGSTSKAQLELKKTFNVILKFHMDLSQLSRAYFFEFL